MKAPLFRYVLRYLIFCGVPYVLAKKIERKYLKSNRDLSDKSDGPESNKDLSDKSNSPELNIRGGGITATIIALLMKDLAFKAAITGLVGSAIWSDTADNLAEQVLRYGGAISAAPGRKLKNIIKKLQGVDSNYALDIREILLERSLSNKEKLELIRVKIQYAMKNLKGKRKILFVTTTISLLIFFLGNGTPAFTYFMAGLRELFVGNDDPDTLKKCVIEIYKEYNAPLPEELITKIIL